MKAIAIFEGVSYWPVLILANALLVLVIATLLCGRDSIFLRALLIVTIIIIVLFVLFCVLKESELLNNLHVSSRTFEDMILY